MSASAQPHRSVPIDDRFPPTSSPGGDRYNTSKIEGAPSAYESFWKGILFFLLVTSVAFAGFNLLSSVGVHGIYLNEKGYAVSLLIFFGLTASFPHISISLFLLSLPLFGNRPGTFAHQVFLDALSAWIFGYAVHLVFTSKWRQCLKVPNSFLLTSWSLFWLVSGLSFMNLSIQTPLLQVAGNQMTESSLSAFAAFFLRIRSLTEHSTLYPIQAFLFLSLAVVSALSIYTLINERRERARQYLLILFLGLCGSFVFGLLDYYGVLSLLPLRELDPVVNPDGKQFRLQSFFAHSGWYAEYLTLSIPFAAVLLTFSWPFWIRATLLLSAMVVGEFVLVLTFQRGGWLSYPLTLIVLWTALYTYRRSEKGAASFLHALRGSLLKVFVSIPLTLGITAILLQSSFHEDKSGELSQYIQRARDIARTNDRTEFMKAGWRIGLLHPFLGGGHESFAYQYDQEIARDRGRLSDEFDLPLHGSAHNVYFQTFAGKGILGLLSFLLLIGVIPWFTWQALRSHKFSPKEQISLLSLFSFSAAIFIYGNVQEIFYIHNLEFLVFASLGIFAGIVSGRVPRYSSVTKYITLGTFGLVLLNFAWELSLPIPKSAGHEFGCFQLEASPDGDFRWCSKNSRLFLPSRQVLVRSPVSTTLILQDGNLEREQRYALQAGVKEQIVIPEDFDTEGPLYLRSSFSFSPFEQESPWKRGADARVLSFQLFDSGLSIVGGG